MRQDYASLKAIFDSSHQSGTDFESFRRDSALVTGRLILFGAALSMLFWMPTDSYIYGPDPVLPRLVSTFRVGFAVLAAMMYFAARGTKREHALGSTVSFAVILVTYSFCLLGFIAGPTVPFAFTSFFVPSITMVFPYTLSERFVAAFLSSILALVSYYAPHPEYLRFNYTGMIFVFLTFTTVSSVGFGHVLFLFQRAMFDQRLRAQRQAVELAEANRTKDAFVATVSHELRTPMNAILGLTDAIIDEKEVGTIHQYAKTIQHSGDLLLSLINDILDLAKIRAGRLELNPAPAAIGDVVERTSALFMVQCRTKGVKLSAVVPDSLPGVVIDAGRFQQILTNLLGNAVKFTDRGEISVRVHLDERAADNGILKVDVLDTGPGVPADKHELIFQAFERVEATAARYSGTGLGLPIVRRLARLMGGDVTLADNPSGGSIFSLVLPVPTVPAEGVERIPSVPPRVADADVWFLICASEASRRMALWELLSRENRHGTSVGSLPSAAEVIAALGEADRHLAGVFIDDPEVTPDVLRGSGLVGPSGRLLAPVIIIRDAIVESEQVGFDALGVIAVIGKPVEPADVEPFFRTAVVDASMTTEPVASSDVAKQRVLVVDDVAENRLVMEVYLRRTPCEVVFATDGLEGVEAFRRQAFDIVFLDIEMPRMNGYEALREMRRWEEAEGVHPTRIVALTAHATSEHQQRIQSAGFSSHLTKPIRRADLYASLTRPDRPAPEARSPFSPPSSPGLIPDEEAVDPELAALRVQYLKDKQESLAMLRDWLGHQRFQDLASLGHRWQGSGASYGYPRISELGARLEEAARLRNAEATDAVIQEAFALFAPLSESGAEPAATTRAAG
jgi:signal transduction histidine kinase/CheY-like chemotaxis protein